MTVHISDVVMNIRYFIATGITGVGRVRMRCAVHGGLPEIFCRRHAVAINMMAISGVPWNTPALPKNGSCGSWCQNYHPIISRRVKTSTWTILARYYELKHHRTKTPTLIVRQRGNQRLRFSMECSLRTYQADPVCQVTLECLLKLDHCSHTEHVKLPYQKLEHRPSAIGNLNQS